MFRNYFLDETGNPLLLTQEVPIVYFAQGIIPGTVAKVKCSSVQSVVKQVCILSKNLVFASQF